MGNASSKAQAHTQGAPAQAQPARQPDPIFDPELKPSLMGMQRAKGGGNSFVRDWIAQNHEGPYDRQFAPQAGLGSAFQVPRGQLTFDAEGTEGGRWHSRTAEVPASGQSGVTIGRGYDIGQHGTEKSKRDLVAAGVPEAQADALAGAGGLKRADAAAWLKKHEDELGEISPEQQRALFETTYGELSADTQRISDKADTREKYGAVDLKTVDPTIRDVLVDLRYRGDYTPGTRKKVQGLAAENDVSGLAAVMNDRSQWGSVPPDRFARRAAAATQGAQEVKAEQDLPFTFAAPFEQVGNPALGLDGRPKPQK